MATPADPRSGHVARAERWDSWERPVPGSPGTDDVCTSAARSRPHHPPGHHPPVTSPPVTSSPTTAPGRGWGGRLMAGLLNLEMR